MEKNKKKKIIKLSILIIFLIILVGGISYAYLSQILYGQRKYVISSGGLQIVLDESQTENNITLANAQPILDENGMKNDKYNFSLINNEDEDLEYTIFLVEDEQTNKTPSEAIRYYYSRDVGEVKVIRGITEQQTEDGKFYLESGVIPVGNTYNYQFCMWLSYEAGNEVMGTTYSIHLEVVASQNLSVYADAALNGADPVLTPNLVPVMIDTAGVVTKASSADKWYDYTNREWANAVVLKDNTIEYNANDIIPESNIESYFVWIPKYKYKVFDEGSYTGVTSLTNATQVIDIVFGLDDSSDSIDGECTTPGVAGEMGNCVVGDYMTHPAFQAFDKNGFWVGKFESGYNGATSTSTAQVNTSDTAKLIIKPNTYSWRNITVGNAFKVAYDYMRNEESHMMKNTEWGAVAYLQHSNYGSRSSVRVNNNSSYITGYAAVVEPTLGYNNGTSISGNLVGTATSVTLPYNTTTGYTASTTNNISGVYDMSGGAHEYVMGYNESASAVGGSSGLTTIYGDFFTSTDWERYYDKYQSTSETGYSNRILGDATGEMGPFGNVKDPDSATRHRTSWYGDYAYFVTAANPWFHRGGNWTYGVEAGAFDFNYYTGGVYTNLSFRVVLAP